MRFRYKHVAHPHKIIWGLSVKGFLVLYNIYLEHPSVMSLIFSLGRNNFSMSLKLTITKHTKVNGPETDDEGAMI